MFDGMAKELRKEFEKVTSRPSKQQSPDLPRTALRKPFDDLVNQPARPTARASPLKASYTPHLEAFDSPLPRPKSRPASVSRHHDYQLPDVTGLTEGLASPERGGPYKKLPTPRKTIDLEKQASTSYSLSRFSEAYNTIDKQLETALYDLESRLNHLENENEHSMRRVREIEVDLHDGIRDKREVDSGIGTGSSRQHSPDNSPPRVRYEPDNAGSFTYCASEPLLRLC
jgi:hypothetical protein